MDMQSVTSFKVGEVEITRTTDGVQVEDASNSGVVLSPAAARELARAIRAWFPNEKRG